MGPNLPSTLPESDLPENKKLNEKGEDGTETLELPRRTEAIDLEDPSAPQKIVALKQLLNQSDTVTSLQLEDHISNIAKSLELGDITTIDTLCEHPVFLEKVEHIIHDQEEKELDRGNRRKIDTYLFDPINKLLDVKTRVYNRLMNDPKTSPIVSPNTSLAHMDDAYFDFDEHKQLDQEQLSKLKDTYAHIHVDANLPHTIQWVIYKAFERYPELVSKNISFVAVDGFKIMPSKQHVMRSQVKMGSLLKEMFGMIKSQDREYVIQVNLLDKEGVMVLPKVSQYSKGGVMTHEFAHTEDYSKKSPLEVLKFGLGFAMSPRRVRNMERKTDETAIARGAGYGLYTFRREIHAGSSGAYVDYKKRTYLGPKEILYAILKHYKSYDADTITKVLQHLVREEY